MINRRSIGIMGCGWLGMPLSHKLSDDFDVECFSREKSSDSSSFWQKDTIIIAIHTKDNYLLTIQKVLDLSNDKCDLILMSSTSIYREFDLDVDESAKITKSSLIKEAEDLLLNSNRNVLILRLGGLMGEDRVAGKWSITTEFSDGFVNYIHKNDVINIVQKMLQSDIKDGIYNLVAPKHPSRSEVHKKNSQKFGSKVGTFDGFSHRKVLCEKLTNHLSYTFLHPDPLEFWN
jgi:nucleoside-diphosphate-sugar epimerase